MGSDTHDAPLIEVKRNGLVLLYHLIVLRQWVPYARSSTPHTRQSCHALSSSMSFLPVMRWYVLIVIFRVGATFNYEFHTPILVWYTTGDEAKAALQELRTRFRRDRQQLEAETVSILGTIRPLQLE